MSHEKHHGERIAIPSCIAIWFALIIAVPIGLNGQTLHPLYEFTGFQGYQNGLVLGSGRIYGVTTGGMLTPGTFFELTPPATPGQSWTETVLYTFTDGFPVAGITRGPEGSFYGTTIHGGASGVGGVYQLNPPAVPGENWKFGLIYSFTTEECPTYGCSQGGPPAVDAAGNVFLADQGFVDCGSIIKLTPPAQEGGAWGSATIHTFLGNGDGCVPNGGLQVSPEGIIYGATSAGTFPDSVAYALSPPATAGQSWTISVLHVFGSSVGDGIPVGGLTLVGAALYGAMEYGGTKGLGGVYQLVFTESGKAQYSLIYSFSGGDGLYPIAAPVVSANGSLYGTTVVGGLSNRPEYSFGTVYELIPPATSGGLWTETTLIRFAGGAGGGHPEPQLAIAPTGTLFGVALTGGTTGYGFAFSLVP